MTLVTCPNCHGRSSVHWPFGPCTICSGTGQTSAAAITGYDYEADIARGSNIRQPGDPLADSDAKEDSTDANVPARP